MTLISAEIPVIETGRLILREPRMADFEAHAAFLTSGRAQFVGGPLDRAQAWRGFSSGIGHWILLGFGMWTIEEKATRQPAGRVGILNPEGWPEPELGWHVYDGFEGRGIAHEAALAARRAAGTYFGIFAPISCIVPENTRSRRLAERLGATVEREGEVLGQPCLVYRHPREAS